MTPASATRARPGSNSSSQSSPAVTRRTRPARACGLDPRLVAIAHAEAAAEVEPAQRDALGSQAREQLGAAPVGCLERLEPRDLRADVQVHADRLDALELRRQPIDGRRLLVGDAELVVLAAGADLLVRAGVDVGLTRKRHRRGDAHGRGQLGDPAQLLRRIRR